MTNHRPTTASLTFFLLLFAAVSASSGSAHAEEDAFALTEFAATPRHLTLGQSVQIVVRVTNVGDADARASVILYADEVNVSAFTTATLRPGQSTRRESTWTPNATGTFAIHLRSENETTEPITVKIVDTSPGTTTLPTTETPTESTTETDGTQKRTPGAATPAVLTILAFAAWTRRRRSLHATAGAELP